MFVNGGKIYIFYDMAKLGTNIDNVINGNQKNAIDAIVQLVENSCDADANTITIKLEYTKSLTTKELTKVTITDDGMGFSGSIQEMNIAFATKGYSSKKDKKSSQQRSYFGKLGKGRFNCLRIGKHCSYKIFNTTENSMYQIIFDMEKLSNANDQNNIDIINLNITKKTDTQIEIIDIDQDADIDVGNLMDKIKSRFAIYIEKHNIKIDIDCGDGNTKNIHKSSIESEINKKDDVFYIDGTKFILKLLYWNKTLKEKNIYLCGEEETVISEKKADLPSKISVFLASEHFNNQIEDDKTKDAVSEATKRAYIFYNEHIKLERQEKIKDWQKNGILLEDKEELSDIEKIERDMFFSIALQLDEIAKLDIRSGKHESKNKKSKLMITMINKITSTDPTAFINIVHELFGVDDLILNDINDSKNLSNLLRLGHLYDQRLRDIRGIEAMINDDKVYELEQLHKVIEKNTWLFGEQHSAMFSNQSLNTVINNILEKKDISVKKGRTRPDLILTEDSEADPLKLLLIELKRPAHNLSTGDMTQADDYCRQIKQSLEDNGKTIEIEAYVISTKLDDNLKYDLKSKKGKKYNNYCYAYTWQDIIQKIKDGLSKQSKDILAQIETDDAYKSLKEKYREYFKAI